MYRRTSTYAKPVLLALLVYACLGIATPRLANAAVTSKYLSVPAKTQEWSNWCWAASEQMVLAYYGQSYSQCTIVTHLWAASCPNWQAHIGDVNLQLWNSYRRLGNYIERAATFAEVRDAINSAHPSIARYQYTDGGGHMVVVYGYYEDTTAGKQQVAYINPANGSAQTVNYTYFKSNGNWTWTHTSLNIR